MPEYRVTLIGSHGGIRSRKFVAAPSAGEALATVNGSLPAVRGGFLDVSRVVECPAPPSQSKFHWMPKNA